MNVIGCLKFLDFSGTRTQRSIIVKYLFSTMNKNLVLIPKKAFCFL